MEIWPAIDIREGRCVRLLRGDFAAETSFGDPVEVALSLAAAGAARLHVVDLDGARTGVPANSAKVLEIAAATGLPLQCGGGIRHEEQAAALLEAGVERVVLGTAALFEPSLLARLVRRFEGRVVVGLDYRGAGQELAVRGWREQSGLGLEEALAALEPLPLAGLVVTDISRDGTAAGPALATYRRLLSQTTLPLLASGGIGTTDHLSELALLEEGGRRLAGAIVGRALLEGRFSLRQAEKAAGRRAG